MQSRAIFKIHGLAAVCRTPLLGAGTVPDSTSLVTVPLGVVLVVLGLVVEPLHAPSAPAANNTIETRIESGMAVL